MAQKFIQNLLFPTWLVFGLSAMLMALEHHPHPEWLAVSFGLVTMLTVHWAERRLPFRREWNLDQGDVKADVSSLATILLLLDPASKILSTWFGSLILIALGTQSGLQFFPNNWPLLAQLALFAVTAEFGRYWIHRASHSNQYLWRIHASHHSATRIYQFNGYRIHPINYLWNYFLGQFPLVLLGAESEVVLLYFVLATTVAAFQHANIDTRHGWLNYIFSTNELHRWHHTTDTSIGYRNHGSVLILWDLLFGSYYQSHKGHQKLRQVGLSNPQHYPVNNFLKQIAAPFCWQRCVANGPENNHSSKP